MGVNMTASEYNYLKALRELSRKEDEVRLKSLANLTGISKASVYNGLNRLINKGLCERSQTDASYKITKLGLNTINEYEGYVDIIESWLVNKLDLNSKDAKKDSINIACNISNSGLEALIKNIN